MANELASAYLTLIPSLKGAQRTIESQLNGLNLDSVNKGLGRSVTTNLGGAFKSAAKIGVGALAGIGAAVSGLAVSGGITRALNIEQAQFKLKNLGLDVEKTMASCNEAVQGTAYGLDAAATVAANLGASGVGAGEEMTKSLKAVAGVAAMSGANMQDIGMIFGQVAAKGTLKGEELLQLSERGLNATAALSEYLGKSQKEVREMVTAGQVDFKTFSDAMYASFGKAAAGANETFSGAMSNVRAALSRLGAKFATPALEGLRKVFVALIPAIDAISVSLDPVVNAFSAWIDDTVPKVVSGIESMTSGIQALSNKMGMIGNAGGLSGLITAAISGNKTFSALGGTVTGAFTSLPSVIERISSGLQTAVSAIGAWFNMIGANATAAISAFGFLGLSVAQTQGKLAGLATAGSAVTAFVQKLSGIASKFAFVGVSSAAITAGLTQASGAFTAFATNVASRLAVISPAFTSLGSKFSASFGAALTRVTPMLSQLGIAAGSIGAAASPALRLAAAFGKLFNPVAMLISSFASMYLANETYRTSVNSLLVSIGTSLLPIFSTLGNTLLTIATAVLPVINNLFTALTPVFGQLALVILQVVAAVAPLITQLVSALAPVIGQIVVAFSNFANAVIPLVAAAFSTIVSAIQAAMPVITTIASVVVSVVSTIISVVGTVVSAVVNVGAVIGSVISTIASAVGSVFSTVTSVIGSIGSFIGGIVATISSTVSGGINFVVGIIGGLVSTATSLFTGLFSGVSGIFNRISSTVGSIIGNIKSKAISIFTNIVSGITSKVSSIKNAIQNGFNGAISFITGLASKASSWGSDIVNGIASGIRNAIGTVTSAVSGVADTIKSFLHFSEPDVGPLSNFHTYMPDMMQGIAEGIESNLGIVRRAVGSASSVISNGLSNWDSSFGYAYSPIVNAAPVASSGNTYIIDGITYGDTDVHISSAVDQLIKATRIAKRS